MTTAQVMQAIGAAINNSPRNAYVAELHLQIIKYADKLKTMSGKEFCQELSIPPAYAVEFAKMVKIAPRLQSAGLDTSRI